MVKTDSPDPEQANTGIIRAPDTSAMVRIPAGKYQPLYTGEKVQAEQVKPFLLDKLPVTNADFRRFVTSYAEWAPGRPPAIKANPGYLRHWRGPAAGNIPITNVSWFAARAFCQASGKRLPTVAEWERAAAAPDMKHPMEGEAAQVKRILEWYARPNESHPAGTVYCNTLGVYDMHGSVWEWTEDFNSVTIDPDGREQGKSDRFCGGGGFRSSSPRDYAAFMRHAFRGSLNAASTIANLGFRCAADAP
jgi:formylglycine-generating enzyme required for sulfatase activity